MVQLQSFMNWLLYHPVLRYHDLVISFVRSSSDLQCSLIRDCSFSRRKLLLEKINNDISLLTSMTITSQQEEHFIKYAEEIMMPLKGLYLSVLVSSRKLVQTGQGNVTCFFNRDAGNTTDHPYRARATVILGSTVHKFGEFRCHVCIKPTCYRNLKGLCQCRLSAQRKFL